MYVNFTQCIAEKLLNFLKKIVDGKEQETRTYWIYSGELYRNSIYPDQQDADRLLLIQSNNKDTTITI